MDVYISTRDGLCSFLMLIFGNQDLSLNVLKDSGVKVTLNGGYLDAMYH